MCRQMMEETNSKLKVIALPWRSLFEHSGYTDILVRFLNQEHVHCKQVLSCLTSLISIDVSWNLNLNLA